jgi:hypothetical protein
VKNIGETPSGKGRALEPTDGRGIGRRRGAALDPNG